MKIDTDAYADGTRVIASFGRSELTVISLHHPRGHVTLSNVASAPMELGEASMLYDVPLFVMKKQFRSPCDMPPKTRYPVRFGSADDLVSGQFERDGDSIRFDLQEQRGSERISFVGTLTYKQSLEKIPADIAIAGWVLFRNSIDPGEGKPSGFATLGDLQNSLR